MLNAFSVDVEDYFQVGAFADRVSPKDWDDIESRVVANTHRVMRLLDRHGVRGTFFVLGWVADRHPGLVHDIHKSGHEIGCHSFWHRLIYEMTPEEFREDLLMAAKAIEAITGERVVAFRAPSFSITGKSLWALEILAEEGFTIDSSIFPIYHDRYGIPGAERFPHEIKQQQGRLWEFPPSVIRVMGQNVPVAGGGYFRLLPVRFTVSCLRRINERSQQPAMFYIHPWEVDPGQPRLPGSVRSRFRHYQNLHRTEAKLDRLLRELSFGTVSQALSACESDSMELTTSELCTRHPTLP